MYIKAGDKESRNIVVVNADGVLIPYCTEVDTDEGWIVTILTEQDKDGNSKAVVDSSLGEVVQVKVYRYFEVVDKTTGVILAQSSSPKIKIKKF